MEQPWGRLSSWSSGAEPVVCAVHGLGGSGRYWQGLADLIGSSWTVVAPDLAGFGQSDKPIRRYDRAFHLDNLKAVIQSVEPTAPIVLVGHSAGAVLAALWAAEHPDRTAGLAMVSVPYPHPNLIPPPARRLAQRPPRDRGRWAKP
ncbi:MAG: alpha/beta hydrolase, partial [Actinomycetota bacterium]|nr:alpha/beta hydrolase [Actinomycetota bacterium]